MRKLRGFLLMGIVAVMAMSCGGSSNSPEEITKAIYSQFQKGNFEKGINIYFENSNAKDEQKNDMMRSMYVEKMKKSTEEKGGIKSFEIIKNEVDESGETAVVVTKVLYGNGEEKEEPNKFVKVDGKWKISAAK